MRHFVLIDLYSQMPYLPQEMRFWPRERVLLWMRQYGEVGQIRWLPNPSACEVVRRTLQRGQAL
jgi:hypothetical protein